MGGAGVPSCPPPPHTPPPPPPAAAQVVNTAKGRVEFDFTPTADMACHATFAAYCGDNGMHIVVRG